MALAEGAKPSGPLWWRAGAVAHAKRMHNLFRDPLIARQWTPLVIPSLDSAPDPAGVVTTDQPAGATSTPVDAFFRNLGTNQRTCFTCHQPRDGWTVSAATVQQRFANTGGNDPIFRLVDGATCPSDDVSTPAARLQAYSLLLNKGLIRVGLPVPSTLTITSVHDPYACSNNSAVNAASTPIYSFYRRPLPTTNLSFQTSNTPNLFMWDGREPSLASQATDATLIHEQALAPPTEAEQTQIVGFESGLFTAQSFDVDAKWLEGARATGGPVPLSTQPFVLGAPQPSATAPEPFDIWNSWAALKGKDPISEARESVARGQAIFNANTTNACGKCHNAVDSGNHDNAANPGVVEFFDTGVANANSAAPPSGQGLSAQALADLDISGLPVFTVQCNDGSARQGQVFAVTDLGRAMISGACADIGAFKTPTLRGLAARAPYFHNGSAATLGDVARFYNDNFNLGLDPGQIQDLVNFLQTL